jgi:hypothetical protein
MNRVGRFHLEHSLITLETQYSANQIGLQNAKDPKPLRAATR